MAGEFFCQPRLAAALREIQRNGRDGFYKGAVMEDMVSSCEIGGLHEEADFTTAATEFVAPISTEVYGYKVWECPPNGQGVAALVLLRLLERFDLAAMDDVDRIHVHAEATKIAYHIRDALVADPVFAKTPVDGLLDASYIDKLEAMIDMNKAAQPAASDFPDHPHTIYLAVVDRTAWLSQ